MELLILAFMAATETFNLPPGLLSAICFTESSHRTYIVHKHDGNGSSLGVCQVKLSTAKMLGYTGTAKQLMDPEGNVYWAAKYLRKQLNRYPGDIPKAVAAYNAGKFNPGKKGLPINQKYVTKVFKNWSERR